MAPIRDKEICNRNKNQEKIDICPQDHIYNSHPSWHTKTSTIHRVSSLVCSCFVSVTALAYWWDKSDAKQGEEFTAKLPLLVEALLWISIVLLLCGCTEKEWLRILHFSGQLKADIRAHNRVQKLPHQPPRSAWSKPWRHEQSVV